MVIASARDLGVCTFPLLEIWTKIWHGEKSLM
jgi:hypothetical protein